MLGGIVYDTDKFVVADTENTSLLVRCHSEPTALTGALNAGGIVYDTDKFVVADTCRDTSIAGTLGVTGAYYINRSIKCQWWNSM